MTDQPCVIDTDLRTALIAEARSWIGTPYVHQASLKGAGADCLGLVRGVYRAVYGNEPEAMPPYTPDWAEGAGVETLALAAARHLRAIEICLAFPGDVLLFRWRPHLPAKHAAILVTPNTVVHAYDRMAVSETHLSDWWRRRIAFAFAFPPLF